MSNNKSVLARASKRNARAKTKRDSANKARQTPQLVRQKQFRATARKLGGFHLDSQDVLTNAVRDINNRRQVDSSINSPQEMIEGIKNITSEVFKLYSYLTLVDALIEKKVIDHHLVVDLKAIGLDFLDMDNRVSRMAQLLANNEEEAILTESLEITTELQNYSDELYAEIVRSEPFSQDIQETINRLSKEFPEAASENEAAARVLQGLAWRYLATIRDEKMQQEQAVQETVEPAPEAELVK